MMDVRNKLETAGPVVAGDRKILVAAQRMSMNFERRIFSALVTPKFVIISERNSIYGFSIPEGQIVNLGELFLENPRFKNEVYERLGFAENETYDDDEF
jgi:hypothetical protein